MATRAAAFVSLALLLLCITSGNTFGQEQEQKTWCVAKPSSNVDTLWENLNYACSKVDCTVLKEGGNCFEPDTLISHASLAMNLYYRSTFPHIINCSFKNSGVITKTDPSYGNCAYA